VLYKLVEDKHVLAIDEPLSVRATKPALYRIADTSLRFYLAAGLRAEQARQVLSSGHADRPPMGRKLWYAGSVKWLDRPFGSQDLAALQRGAPEVPGFDPGKTALIGVSSTGFTDSAAANLAFRWLPEDIVSAFAVV
jgi:hypothetical protein